MSEVHTTGKKTGMIELKGVSPIHAEEINKIYIDLTDFAIPQYDKENNNDN